jgi:hypothetical protein
MLGAKWGFAKKHFLVPIIKYYHGGKDLENGADLINEVSLLPNITINLPAGLDFVTFWGNYDWHYNFEDGVVSAKQSGDYFIPWDITIGKMLSDNKVVLSATFAGELASRGDYDVIFDEQFMLRIGFFF